MKNTKQPQINEEIYEIIENRPLTDLKSQGLLLKHKKTGARVNLVLNDDDNKVFYIAFRTPPTDSTGLPHILEHCVLCGSESFPVKDPFVELAKGSLNTFLNAMTYPDKTVYPIASVNDKDFANLMHVYLDAVFFPNIYKEEKIFMQEGWHYEVDEESGELSINGVVYNEMKGVFSTPDSIVDRQLTASLYPDTTYGMESGGDPEAIPTLTYAQFLDFHRRFYHPANSYIYLYGDLDAAERLDFLDRYYLSRFDALEIDSAVKKQESFSATRFVTHEYPVLHGDDTEESTYLTYNIALDIDVGKEANAELYIAFQILDYAICQAPGAALRQTLLDKKIGKDVYSSMYMGIAQPYFSLVAKDAQEERQDEFVAAIEGKLQDLVENGIDKKALAAGLNAAEFRYREADFGSYPRGLIFGLQTLDSWLYDDSQPFTYLEMSSIFATLKEKQESGFYEGLIKKYYLDNSHKSVLKVVPVVGLTAAREEELRRELSSYCAGLSADELKAISKNQTDLAAYQEEMSSAADLAKIPVLERGDIEKKATPFVNELRHIGKTKLLFHDIFTGGIGYLRLIFDITKIPSDLFPYLGILKEVFSLVDTENYSYADLFSEVNIHTGGISASIATYPDHVNLPRYQATFEIRAKYLYEKIDKAFALAEEIILRSSFENDKRMYEIIAEIKSRLETGMQSGGHKVASMRALSYISERVAIGEELSGIEQYRLVADIEANFSEKKSELYHKLKTVAAYLFRADNLMVDYTGEANIPAAAIMEKATADFIESLEANKRQNEKQYPEQADESQTSGFVHEVKKKNEGFITAGQIQYVCRAGSFITKELPYTGALRALKVMMGLEYLWTQIRVLGGAYGCMCNFSETGDSYFVSYRDPHLARTVDVFQQASAFIREYQGDTRAIDQFVIGAIGDLDTPMTPAMKGAYGLSAYMCGIEFADLQRERDELLSVDLEVLRSLYRYVEAFIAGNCFCVVGSEEKIKENEEMFIEVMPLLL
ncbi:MAG: insulinase family protein [Lachnospiraceae bacterium]|jgi:Zn-dependent M16 (insulinase) family peptidase|nr:insulinase family protein [Lachnospiraceae bacterium]